MNTKHTPGPWNHGPTHNRLDTPIYAEAELGFDLATVHCGGSESTLVANSRLIAAAPDLLAALERLLETVALNEDDGHEEDGEAIEVARAALLKATESDKFYDPPGISIVEPAR